MKNVYCVLITVTLCWWFFFLSECWLNANTNLDLEGYNSIAVPRKRRTGGGLVLFFKEYLNDKLEIINIDYDCIVWIRCDKSVC